MSEKKLILQSSPHLRDQDSVRKVMMTVVVALLPAIAASVWFFGWAALVVQVVAVVACLAFEALGLWLLKKPMKEHLTDGSAIVTGLLLAMNLPSNIPMWMTVVGAAVAILIAKIPYGGIGNNPFNPALVGRVFMFVAFPVEMTSWPVPFELGQGGLGQWVNATTSATPLGVQKFLQKGVEGFSQNTTHFDLFIGHVGGCIGEVSAAALLLGGLILLWKKVITWHIPVAFIGTVAVFTAIFHYGIDSTRYADPLFNILSGGVMIGAIFMATDMVTSPVTPKGMLIFGFGCGLITCLIRLLASFPEGVSFSILVMNGLTPMIDRYIKPASFAKG